MNPRPPGNETPDDGPATASRLEEQAQRSRDTHLHLRAAHLSSMLPGRCPPAVSLVRAPARPGAGDRDTGQTERSSTRLATPWTLTRPLALVAVMPK